MAYDSARGVTVLFGGQLADGTSAGDTWEWDGTGGGAWTQRAVTGPSGRVFTAMAYDPVRNRTVLFGGTNFYGALFGDTWEWDGATWTQRVVSGPAARSQLAMTYDAMRGVTVLFGGSGTSVFNDTWEWDGTAWTQRVISGPLARSGHAMAYDASQGVSVCYGGNVSGTLTQFDTWFLGVSPFISQQPVGAAVREGSPATFSVTVVASPGTTYHWRRNAVPLSDGGAVSGSTSPTLTISPTSMGDTTAVFDCDVANTLGAVRTNTVGLSVIPRCGSADFNGDGAIGTDADIEAFFRVLGGGSC
jgi:hypothetical protein